MGAGLRIENSTDRAIAVHFEQISVRYWAMIPAGKRIMWNSDDTVHLDRGAYTLRAFDAFSRTYTPPNMKKETAKAVVGGMLIGAGGAALLVSVPLFAVPGVALTVGGVAVVGGTVAAGVAAAAGAASGSREYKSGVKRGARIGKETKYVVKCTADEQELEWEKVEYDDDDEDDADTIYAVKGERYISTENFDELRKELIPPVPTPQSIQTSEHVPVPEMDQASRYSPPQCDYFRMCKRYLDTIDNIESGILAPQYDKCFCDECASERGDAKTFEMGNPKKMFTVPWGFAKFGIKISPIAEEGNIFEEWHVCYHGTKASDLCDIVNCGRLLKPGDIHPNGSLKEPGVGRWTKTTAPEGHNVNQYFFSPTPAYSEMYSKKVRYTDTESSECYSARTVLQARIKPGTYNIRSSTVAPHVRRGPGPIDRNFSDDELEWMTDRECVHHIYGILIKLEKLNDSSAI